MIYLRYLTAAAVWGVALTLVSGCASSEYSDVSGTIRFNGEMVKDGAITFVPSDGTGPTAGGMIKEGTYTATKVPIGRSKVSITSSKLVGTRKAYDAPDSPTIPIAVELLPAKYNTNTELTLEVKPGVNEKHWDLTK